MSGKNTVGKVVEVKGGDLLAVIDGHILHEWITGMEHPPECQPDEEGQAWATKALVVLNDVDPDGRPMFTEPEKQELEAKWTGLMNELLARVYELDGMLHDDFGGCL